MQPMEFLWTLHHTYAFKIFKNIKEKYPVSLNNEEKHLLFSIPALCFSSIAMPTSPSLTVLPSEVTGFSSVIQQVWSNDYCCRGDAFTFSSFPVVMLAFI